MSAPGRGGRGKVGKSSLSRVSIVTNGRVDNVQEVLLDSSEGRIAEGSSENRLEDEEKTLVGESRSRSRA